MTRWNIIFRQVASKANQLAADSPSEYQTAYLTAQIGQTQLGDRAVEFPKEAIDDAIVNAASQLISAIGHNPKSTYRRNFLGYSVNRFVDGTGGDVIFSTGHSSGVAIGPMSGQEQEASASISTGDATVTASAAFFEDRHLGRILNTGTDRFAISSVESSTVAEMSSDATGNSSSATIESTPIVGLPSRCFTADTTMEELYEKPLEVIRQINKQAGKMAIYDNLGFFHFDGERIWHTLPTTKVVLEFVVWSAEATRLALDADPTENVRGKCPFPPDLHEALVSGALSQLFRANFNLEQVQIWNGYFQSELSRIAQPSRYNIADD